MFLLCLTKAQQQQLEELIAQARSELLQQQELQEEQDKQQRKQERQRRYASALGTGRLWSEEDIRRQLDLLKVCGCNLKLMGPLKILQIGICYTHSTAHY
jgi:hypothetical protein